MSKRFFVAALSAVVLGIALFGNPGQSSASFHFMRVKAAMGGLNGDATVQYVEIRSTFGTQNQLASNNAVLCFFDATGAPYARFKYPTNPPNAANGASYLVGTASFDTAWAAGSPDYTFSPANTIAIAGGADVDHPLRSPGGSVSFGQDFQNTAALMCQGSYFQADSVVYGSDGLPDPTVDYPPKLASNMPTGSTSGVHLVGSLCNPCARNNSLDYAIADLNAVGAQPRNSLNNQGPLSSDVDADGVPNTTDLCPATISGPVDANGCSDAQVDPDTDAICSPGAPSGGPSSCTGVDNCPSAANNDQADGDGDGDGNVCDNCPVWPNPSQAALPWPVPVGDADCDGFRDTVVVANFAPETAIGTDPLIHCAQTPGANNDPDPDVWPVDFNDDRGINGQDVGKYGGPFGAGNHLANQGPFGPPGQEIPGVRFDFNGDGAINGQDSGRFQAFYNKLCTP